MSEMEARNQSCPHKTTRCPSQARLPHGGRLGRNQDGAVAVVFAVAIIGLVGFCGLALDLALVYNRKVEMRNIADAAALGAARRLNGTASGITNAVAAATTAATAMKYQYNKSTINWSAAAIKFSTSPDRDGTWVDAGTAAAAPARITYVKVNTAQLDGGDVQPLLMHVLSDEFASVPANSDAIAGRTTLDVAPLAICAMSQVPGSPRTSGINVELVEYGFRRGVSYDLMNLNPLNGPPANFLINPLAPPGTPGLAADLLAPAVGPYVCTGTLGIPRIFGDTIAVSQPFPIATLFTRLNSRFDQYVNNVCNFNAAPPDINIRSFVSSPTTIPPWITTGTGQTAACNGGAAGTPCSPTAPKRQTVADLAPPGGTAAEYGPVWAYAKAVRHLAYVSGMAEPSTGYTTFTTSSWSELYGGQTVRTYPSGSNTPYKALSGVNFLAPDVTRRPGAKDRRVLNVPLLDCTTAPGNAARALAIGKFFMTVPATATTLAAEFAGAVPLENANGNVGLFR